MSEKPLVAVCTCFDTLSGAIPGLALEQGIVARYPGVRLEFLPSLCRQEDGDRLAALIEEKKPPAVLFAACSPFAKGRTVLESPARYGCSIPADLVDIREGCAWIHAGNREEAAAKAVDLVCMGLAGLTHRKLGRRPSVEVAPRVLVVGAGPAGLAAAGTLAGLSVSVTLVDRLGRPGGMLNQIGRLFPSNSSSRDFLAPLLREAALPSVDFLPKTVATRIDGDPGQFRVGLSRDGQESELTAGAVILACGALPVLPENRFRSGELRGVVSQLELESRLKKLETEGAGPPDFQNAVFIQCMAARDDVHPYCSSICCPTALKNGLRLKALKPDMNVTVLHRGIMAPGQSLEELYRQAMAAGVRFIAYSATQPPEVAGNDRVGKVILIDSLSGRRISLPADLVVLSTPLKPRPETANLAGGIGVRLDEMGFACGSEPMQPLIAPVPGVYLCGGVRWPVHAEQAVDQGRAAAVKAAAFLARGEIDSDASALPGSRTGTAEIWNPACSRCGRCVAVCPYGACRRDEEGTVSVIAIRCRGCGTCAAVCPSGAAFIPGHNVSLRAMLREIAPRTRP